VNVRWRGDRAVLVTVNDAQTREQLADALHQNLVVLGDDAELRRGMQHVLVEVSAPDPDLLRRVEEQVRLNTDQPHAGSPIGHTHRIPVRYDGTDLADTASALDVTVPDLVSAHSAQRWRVAMIGFAPGFAYLEPFEALVLDWSGLQRRSTPRPRVPRGSVALAAGMSAVYPSPMPGGWHLIGTSDAVLFDVERPSAPSLLAPGDLVIFEDVTSR